VSYDQGHAPLLARVGDDADVGPALLEGPPGEQLLEEPPRPLLKGWLHLLGFVASLPAGVLVVATAPPGRARWAALVYALALSSLFGVSATYHRRTWTATGLRRMRRVDHGTIFVMIAGSYTPLCLLALRGPVGTGMLIGAWTGAAIGLGFAVTGIAEKPYFGLGCYLGLGWVVTFALPTLSRRLSVTEFLLLMLGGLTYTLGGVVLGSRWPNPFPRVFGYHEVWHVMVVGASVCHYLLIYSVVHAAG
jgi:hemolysin III